MGKQSRQRRAARQRARQTLSDWRPTDSFMGEKNAQPLTPEQISTALLTAAAQLARRSNVAVKDCAQLLTSEERFSAELELGAQLATQQLLNSVFNHGWLPMDIHQAARRRLDEFAGHYLIDALAIHIEPFTPATVHPAWRAQLDELEAIIWWSKDEPHLGQWAKKHILTPFEAVKTVLKSLALLLTLPHLEAILPRPGTAQPARASVPHHVNEKMLSRVRALLAKAESTAFPEEAEALSAKAQELMTRHALDHVLVQMDTSTPDIVSARRLWLETPYLDSKSLLVNVVARANRCRAIFHAEWGFLSIVGDEVDLDAVELLATSLLVQATRAMIASGQQASHGGQSRTRSFRQSFLVAYATRIGERLEKANETMIADIPDSARLLPVLASHQLKVNATFEKLFSSTVGKSVTVRNRAGWGAGRAAADRASLDSRRPITN